MIKKVELKTFEQINQQLSLGKKVYYNSTHEYYTKENGIIIFTIEGTALTDKFYNASLNMNKHRSYYILEEVEDPAVKPEVGYVFETNKGTQVYINLKKGNKFYGAELNGKQNSCKVLNEDGKVEMRNTYLVKKIK